MLEASDDTPLRCEFNDVFFTLEHRPFPSFSPVCLPLHLFPLPHLPLCFAALQKSHANALSYPCYTRPGTYTSWRCMSKPSHVFCSNQDTANTQLVPTDTPRACAHFCNKRARERGDIERCEQERERREEKPSTECKLNLLFIKYQESKMPPQPNAEEKKFGK